MRTHRPLFVIASAPPLLHQTIFTRITWDWSHPSTLVYFMADWIHTSCLHPALVNLWIIVNCNCN